MTTTVTVRTHSWPAEITTIDEYDGKRNETVERVEPNSSRSLLFRELPLDPKPEEPAAA